MNNSSVENTSGISGGTIAIIIVVIIIFLIVVGILIWYFLYRNPTDLFVPLGPTSSNTGPTGSNGNIVRYGDTIRVFNLNDDMITGQYLSPCGNYLGCATTVTLRTDPSYVLANGDANQLRSWIINSGTGITMGTPVQYEDIIILNSLDSANLNTRGNPLALCLLENGDINLNAANVNNNYPPGSHLWKITKDPANVQTSNIITYDTIINIKVSTGSSFLVRNNTNTLPPDVTGVGCGYIITLGSNETPGYKWTIRK